MYWGAMIGVGWAVAMDAGGGGGAIAAGTAL